MGRENEMKNALIKEMDERFFLTCERIQKAYDENKKEIIEKMVSVFRDAFHQTMMEQQSKQKGAAAYLFISGLKSSLLTENWYYRVETFDEGCYLDDSGTASYYCPDYLMPFFKEDLIHFHKIIQKDFVRIKKYELDAIRDSYIYYYHSIVLKMCRELIPIIVENSEFQVMEKAGVLKVIFNDYMDEGILIHVYDEEKKTPVTENVINKAQAYEQNQRLTMKYFLMETDDNNPIPWGINAEAVVDIRNFHFDTAHKIPKWNMVPMRIVDEMLYPDVISAPFYMISKECTEVIELYSVNTEYKAIILFHEKSGENVVYYAPIFEEIGEMEEECEYNKVHSKLKKIVLNQAAIGERSIFRIAGFDTSYIVVRLDLMESLLRRGIRGIKLTEVEVRK